MIELPHSWRTLLVEALDNYCDTLDDTSDPDAIAEAVIEQVEAVSHEVTGVEAEEIINQLEESMDEDEESLAEALSSRFASSSFDFSGERIVQAIERLCEIEYLATDEEDEAAGFFEGGAPLDEEF